MSKYKKKRDKSSWESFVSRIFTRKREYRPYILPKEYLMSVADQLWKNNPTKEIVYNTLVGVASLMYERGYNRKGDDCKRFKSLQEAHMEAEFKEFQDYLDDYIHNKDEIKPTFTEWQAKQAEIRKQLQQEKSQSNNQSK